MSNSNIHAHVAAINFKFKNCLPLDDDPEEIRFSFHFTVRNKYEFHKNHKNGESNLILSRELETPDVRILFKEVPIKRLLEDVRYTVHLAMRNTSVPGNAHKKVTDDIQDLFNTYLEDSELDLGITIPVHIEIMVCYQYFLND